MIKRIKDMGSFMTKHFPKRVVFLLWVLLCLSIPLKSAYATCSYVPVGEMGYNYGVCTTAAEAVNYSPNRNCVGWTLYYDSDSSGGFALCHCSPDDPPTAGCWEVFFGNSGCTNGKTQSCTTSTGCPGTQTCISGQWGVCQKIDPCCKSPDPCCGVTDRCCDPRNGGVGK